jgi:hypothetical protein
MENLNEIAARWLGYKYRIRKWMGSEIVLIEVGDSELRFDPEHNLNDLAKAQTKLPQKYITIIGSEYQEKGHFTIRLWGRKAIKKGRYPADYSKAILELVKTLYERGKEDE